MKKGIYICIFIFSIGVVPAQHVFLNNAIEASSKWYHQNFGIQFSDQDFEEDMIYAIKQEFDTLILVVNFVKGGYLILSADSAAYPILGYSYTGHYDPDNVPPQLTWLLDNYKGQILYIKHNLLYPDSTIAKAWKQLNQVTGENLKGTNSVDPLLTSCWDQGSGWNSLCPADPNGPGGHVWAGCVAVAMAQVMNYWTYPTIGEGSHSYQSNYGTLSANFGATEYNWTSMPDEAWSNSIAQLLFHCGVAVEMDYSPNGSGASMNDARNALKNYFKYSSSASYKHKNNYQYSTWTSMLRDELDNNRPVVYAGYNSAGEDGHAFVIDGYENTTHFHINWGWSCSFNGYFYLTSLNPGTSNFTTNQGGIFNVEPDVPCGQILSGSNTTGIFEDRCYIKLSPGFTTQPNSEFRARVVPAD